MQRPFPARPFVSFIMATFNRGPVVVDCLRKTLAVARPALGEGRFNIIVVDNASSDNTADLVGALAAQERHIKLIRLPQNCGPVAKNVALHKNGADILVLLDDDAYPLPGALAQMVRHFQDDPHLGAAVFDVTLPDGAKESSAYPDVFIGAGTALRGTALRALADTHRPGRGLFPADFFMQAEEYDLSFRLLADGWSIQRFWDMPLLHLKAPGARIGQRTTRLDVRNNLWLLARYLPEPLAAEFAADWLARYWHMALERDGTRSVSEGTAGSTHRAAFIRGAAEGLLHWQTQRGTGDLILPPETLERIFKFDTIRERLCRAKDQHGLRRIAFGDWGKNLLAYYKAARELNLEVVAVVRSTGLSPSSHEEPAKAGTPNNCTVNLTYRGVPIIEEPAFREHFQARTDALVITAMSRVHAGRRAAELRRTLPTPVFDLFSPNRRQSVSVDQPLCVA